MKTKSSRISTDKAVGQLSAIAHKGRLSLLRLLIKAGPGGIAATDLAKKAKTKLPTASAQLLVLSNAGLVKSTRVGRQVIYQADYSSMATLLCFLTNDCCGGDSDICSPVIAALKT